MIYRSDLGVGLLQKYVLSVLPFDTRASPEDFEVATESVNGSRSCPPEIGPATNQIYVNATCQNQGPCGRPAGCHDRSAQ